MSASREKKKRQEISASGAADPRAARAAEQRAAERKSNILYGTVAAIFVVVAVALVVFSCYYPLKGWIRGKTMCEFGLVMEYFGFSIYSN